MAEKSAKKYTEEFVYALAKCDIASFLGVAKILGITKERVRQIEAQALKKLKHPKMGKQLKDYINI